MNNKSIEDHISSVGTRKTVDKAMQIMAAFTKGRPELSIGDLAEKLGTHKSVVSRIVSTLRMWDMLEKNPVTGRLRIGSAAFRIGSLFSHRENGLADIASPLLTDLMERTGHSVRLSVLKDEHILIIETVESPNAPYTILRSGDQHRLYTTAAGKIFMAFSKQCLMHTAFLSSGFKPVTPKTITTEQEMEQNLIRVRRESIAYNCGENTQNSGAVAAPVLSRTGDVIAAVSTVFPLIAVDAEKRSYIALCTKTCAAAISTKIAQLPHRNLP